MDRLEHLRKTPRCGSADKPPESELDSVNGLIDLIEFARPRRVLEIGSDVGVSTETFLLLCDHVTAVDPWGDYPEIIRIDPDVAGVEDKDGYTRMRQEHGVKFLERCGGYPNLRVIRDYSPRALLSFPDDSFDLVYIDAVHQYQQVVDDVRAATRLIVAAGWIAGHDYWPSNKDDVVRAVDELFGDGVKVFRDGSWVARLTALRK